MTHNPYLFFNNYRFFGRRGFKYPKGSMGRETSAAANSGFPKHKELFTEGYFNGEPTYDDQRQKYYEENVQSPLEKRFNQMNEM